ncbi:hypothetical protein IM816_10775 [Luteibacter flocculans]|uniref:Delta-60 repeat protein n=1 Tax=Luteibacter flocculans TaxID=2780091 RepID=A0ABY4SWP0_9GAMM|nr:hypothetical protein [Luteibacter flocculans]URL57138.1 hypothetical protein IM816_10775 [Luteibacter flocculans]
MRKIIDMLRPDDIDLSFGKDGRLGYPGYGVGLPASDGKYWLFREESAGNPPLVEIVRLLNDGSPDPAFPSGGTTVRFPNLMGANNLYKAVEQSNAKIVLCGTLYDPKIGTSFPYVMRINAEGDIDPSFAEGGIKPLYYDASVQAENKSYRDVVIQPDGKIVVLATNSGLLPSNKTWSKVIRLTARGQMDATFGRHGVFHDLPEEVLFLKIVSLKDNALLMGGMYARAETPYPVLVRLTAEGEIDRHFGDLGIKRLDYVNQGVEGRADVNTIALFDDDDSMVVGGLFITGAEPTGGWIVALHSDGTPDADFNGGKPLFVNDPVVALATQGSQVILQGYRDNASDASSMYLGRLDRDGSPDTEFGEDGIVIAPPHIATTRDIWRRHHIFVNGQDKKTLLVSSAVVVGDKQPKLVTQLVRFLLS